MQSNFKTGKVLLAAALLAVPGVAMAQDNTLNNADASVANDTLTDPTLTDPAATDLGAANGVETTAMPSDETLASDMALANTVEPAREDDKDFPWGLLGLLGLAGLMGRKKSDIHVDARTDRRDV